MHGLRAGSAAARSDVATDQRLLAMNARTGPATAGQTLHRPGRRQAARPGGTTARQQVQAQRGAMYPELPVYTYASETYSELPMQSQMFVVP